jgi:hypothetical protein
MEKTSRFIVVVTVIGQNLSTYEVVKKKRYVIYCICPDEKKANQIAKALNALESEK